MCFYLIFLQWDQWFLSGSVTFALVFISDQTEEFVEASVGFFPTWFDLILGQLKAICACVSHLNGVRVFGLEDLVAEILA